MDEVRANNRQVEAATGKSLATPANSVCSSPLVGSGGAHVDAGHDGTV